MEIPNVDIEAFVENGAKTISVSDLEEIRRLIPNLEQKLASIEDGPVKEIEPLVRFLSQYLLSPASRAEVMPVHEAAFALKYFLKGVDIIPDLVPEIGYTDDLAILRLVYQRNHDAFSEFAKAESLTFPA